MRAVYVLAGLGLAITVAVGLIVYPFGPDPAPVPEPEVAEAPAAAEKITLLEGIDLEAGPVVLVLHPLATGGEMMAVTDAVALKAAQDLPAFYTDDKDAELKLNMAAILALSPPGMPTRSTFATLAQNGKVVRQLTCFALHCQGKNGGGLPHERDLGGLLDAARPVVEAHDFFDTASAAHLKLAEINGDPDLFLLNEPDLPPADAAEPPGKAMLYLPLRIRTATSEADFIAWDQDAEAANLLNLVSGALTKAGAAIELGTLRFDQVWGPMPVIDAQTGRTVGNPGETPLLDGFAYAGPSLPLIGTEAELDRLRDLDIFADLVFPEDASGDFDAAFAALIKEKLGSDCTECFSLRVPLAVVPAPELGPYEAPSYYLGWYEIGDRTDP